MESDWRGKEPMAKAIQPSRKWPIHLVVAPQPEISSSGDPGKDEILKHPVRTFDQAILLACDFLNMNSLPPSACSSFEGGGQALAKIAKRGGRVMVCMNKY